MALLCDFARVLVAASWCNLSNLGLCPDGQLSSTKGSRYVLASAEESWARIQALCVRVQDLEYALDKANALVSNATHPLLDAELKKIGQDPRAVIKGNTNNATSSNNDGGGDASTSGAQSKSAVDVPISQFGTMKISKTGFSRWLGVSHRARPRAPHI